MEKIKSTFIRKRNNKYYVYVEYEDEIGKRKQKSQGSFELKKDADKLLIEIKNDINKDVYSVPKNITFVERCYKYYDIENKNFSPTTVNGSLSCIKNHVEPYFKDTLVSDLTVSRYQDFLYHLYNKELGYLSKETVKSKTDAVLNECYRLREINIKITDFATAPKNKNFKQDIDIYDIEDIKLILNNSKNKGCFEIIVNLYVYAGMRMGEIIGLTWDNIDFNNNIIHIKNNLVYTTIDGKSQWIMKPTKTYGSERSITVPEHLIELFKKEKIRQNKLKLHGLLKNNYDTVCISNSNKYIYPDSFRQSFKTFVKKIGLPYKKPHSLRHSHITMLMLGGVDIKTISARVGHADATMTLNTYAHVLLEMDRSASSTIETLLI